MHLVVFDLDSALCPTNTMDGLALSKALQDVTGHNINPELLVTNVDFRNTLYKVESKEPSATKVAKFRGRYNFHLKREYLIRPSVIPANYALIEHANSLQNRKDSLVAIVSSTSLAAIELKSRSIGLLCEMMPVATSEDSDSLDGVLRALNKRVRRGYGAHCNEATLVSNNYWALAAKMNHMTHIEPEDFEARNSRHFDWFRSKPNKVSI